MALDIEKLNNAFFEAKERYNELNDVSIYLKAVPACFFTMRAKVGLFVFLRKERQYFICINSKREKLISQLSHADLIGWFGHELTHILEYEKMTFRRLVYFTVKYVFNTKFRSLVEKDINAYAFNNGFAQDLFGVWEKLMLFDNISIRYKNYIRENYKPDWAQISTVAESIGLSRVIYELN